MKSIMGALIYVLRIPPPYLFCSVMILVAGISLSIMGAGIFSLWPRVIIGLLVFLLPGCYLYILTPTRDNWDLADVVGHGFAYSMALITILGLIMRTLTWSISTVVLIWFVFALLGCGAVIYKTRFWQSRRIQLPPISIKSCILVAIVCVLLTMYMHASVFLVSISDDQSRHHGAIHGLLRSEPLGWSEPYYESGNPIADQDYLTYWILVQALVVKISDAHILLARYLLNPFALTMSVAAMYVFARNLGHGRTFSICAVILGLLALSLIAEKGKLPGNQFFVHVHLDKVLASFALAPVTISSAWLYAESGDRRALFGFALSFLACSFVHSVIGGFALCVIGVWCLLEFFVGRGRRKYIYQIGLLALILFLPSIVLRLISLQPTITPFGTGGWFYGIEPRNAGFLTYLMIVLTTVCAAARRDARSRLILSFVLVIGIGLLPLTAWLYRILLPDFQIARVVWLMPYGYMIAFVIETGWRAVSSRDSLRRLSLDRLRIPLLILAIPITAYFLQFHSRADFSKDIGNATEEVLEMLEIAEYIDANHTDRVWIAASPEPEHRNRAISMNWKVISLSRYSAERMAYYSNLPIEQTEMQRADNFRLYGTEPPVEEKLAIIDRYDIDYLLFPKSYAWMVDALYQMDKQRFELVYSGEPLRLVRVHEKAS